MPFWMRESRVSIATIPKESSLDFHPEIIEIDSTIQELLEKIEKV
jgi:hypothetical protein